MNRVALLSVLVAAAALAGCNKSEPVVNEAANAVVNEPLVLPPSIVASKAYRCKDNSLAYVDFLSDGKTATVRDARDATPTALTMTEPGKPYTAEGYSLTGSATDANVTITRPGKGSQSCHV